MDGKLNAICQSYTFYRLGASTMHCHYTLPTRMCFIGSVHLALSHAVPVSWFIYVYPIIRNILQIGVVKTSYCLRAHIAYIFDILGKI